MDTYQGKADIDGGGDLQVHRFDVGLLGQVDLLEQLRWTNTFFFSVNDYDFGGGGFSTGDPRETILTLRLVTKLRYQLSAQWGVFSGGVFIFAPETGADWGDSFTGGGLAGVDFRHSQSLFVSLGVAVISQIEDEASVAPAINLTWLPSERWAVRVGAVPASGGSAAAGEVAYRVTKPLEVGLGLLYYQRRFQILIHDVRIDHRGREITVPEGFLHQANILGLPVEFRREGVPQHMGMGILGQPRFAALALHHGAQGTGMDRCPLEGGKQESPGGRQGRPTKPAGSQAADHAIQRTIGLAPPPPADVKPAQQSVAASIDFVYTPKKETQRTEVRFPAIFYHTLRA